jgi:heme-degrading monooxygenase HmoA
MYLRILRLLVREGQEAALTRFYQERVIPAMATTDGCRYAGLLAPWRGEAHQSLTIWESAEAALRYEEGELYPRLLAEVAPLLADRAEWRFRLARDPLETADPARREPPSEGYRIEADEGSAALDGTGRPPFVRIVAIRVAPGRLADFVAIYRDQVIPALRAVHGCRGVFLAERAGEAAEALSITLWNREEDAVRYEMSGEFERLTARLKETFSPTYDWRTRLGDEIAGGGRPEVSSYQLVRGRRLTHDPEPSS